MNPKDPPFILLIVFILSFHALAKATHLKLCGVEWPPFTFVDKEKIIKGISYDVITEATTRLKWKFQAESVPWSRCVFDVKHGIYDAVIDDRMDQDKFDFKLYPTSFYLVAMYVRKNYPQNTFSWNGIKGKVVGGVRGYSYTDVISKFNDWQRKDSNNDETLFRKLNSNRYNYILSDIFSAPIYSKKLGIPIKQLEPLVDSTPLYVSFAEKKYKLAKQFYKIIDEMIQDGSIDAIYSKNLSLSYNDIKKKVSEKATFSDHQSIKLK